MNMVTLSELVGLLIVVTILVSVIAIYKLLSPAIKAYEKKVELMDMAQVLSYDYTTDNTANILDNMISEAVTQYKILNIECLPEVYITDKLQEDMIRVVLESVLTDLSPNIIKKLSFTYSTNRIEDLVLQKTRMVVLDYIIETNGTYSQ